MVGYHPPPYITGRGATRRKSPDGRSRTRYENKNRLTAYPVTEQFVSHAFDADKVHSPSSRRSATRARGPKHEKKFVECVRVSSYTFVRDLHSLGSLKNLVRFLSIFFFYFFFSFLNGFIITFHTPCVLHLGSRAQRVFHFVSLESARRAIAPIISQLYSFVLHSGTETERIKNLAKLRNKKKKKLHIVL